MPARRKALTQWKMSCFWMERRIFSMRAVTAGRIHGAGLVDGVGHPLDIKGVDQKRAALQLGRRPGEFAENEHAVVFDGAGAELLGHQIHAVLERRDQGNLAGAVVGQQLDPAERTVDVVDRRPADLGEAAVDLAHQTLDFPFQGLVFRDLLAAGHHHLDQGRLLSASSDSVPGHWQRPGGAEECPWCSRGGRRRGSAAVRAGWRG